MCLPCKFVIIHLETNQVFQLLRMCQLRPPPPLLSIDLLLSPQDWCSYELWKEVSFQLVEIKLFLLLISMHVIEEGSRV